MIRSTSFRALALSAPILVLAACSGKSAPAPPPEVPKPIQPVTTEVAPSAQPRPSDATESPLDGDLAAATAHAYATGLLGDIYFDLDQADLRTDGRERLQKNAAFLKEHPEFVVRVEGHADDRGTNDYNLALGERRAQTVREFLIAGAVNGGRIGTLSWGEEKPQCTTTDDECRQRNRRAHFLLVDRIGGR